MLAVPQFRVLRIGPAGRERAVYQDDPAPDYLDGLRRVRHEFLQHRLHERYQDRRIPGNGGL